MRDLEVEGPNAKSRILEDEAKVRLMDAEANIMAKENWIMLTDLDIHTSLNCWCNLICNPNNLICKPY
jgi:hypothetical protein